ncbi:glycosyltransferase family 1 protein [Metabacillus indicus]|uniref:glycosyltransferase family 1 protein n=1 Tax=Metabacillus indicus TaxID=246786 RepID=UPI0004934FF3|nr:glycosyltransferase family 1 protein [Metabacillus indicus]KEZ50335.1 glycosyl transferase family 1 [Metabacillus indicus LMG 22858]
MKPMRVLQVVTIMNRGGLETMLMNYYRKIDRSKIQFDFMVHRMDRGHYDDEIEELGGQIFRMPAIRPGRYREYIRSLDDFFKVNNTYKVVHAHINENSGFVLRAAKYANVPCRIAHSHTSDLGIDYKFPFRLYGRFIMKDIPTNYYACSSRAASWLFGNKVNKSGKVKIINNAVNLNEYKFNQEIRNSVRSDLKIENKLVIGHVGRFHSSKNHSFLIEIFREIYNENPDTVLLLAGEGPTRLKIEQKVKKLGLTNNVKFLGVRTDIPRLMQAMDIFLFPSFFEGLPVVLVEAQAAGLPIFASNTITRDTNITGTISFFNIKIKATTLAKDILTSNNERHDTFTILKEKGFDSVSVAKGLEGYYLENSLEMERV